MARTKVVIGLKGWDHVARNQDAGDTVDPRLGMRFDLAGRWESTKSGVSLEVSGSSGASPYQFFRPFADSPFRPYTPFDRSPFSGAIHFYSCTFRFYRGRFKGYKSDRRN